MAAPAKTRAYRVFFHAWDVYDVILDAHSEDDAVARAVALHRAEGLAAFDHLNSGDDGFVAEPFDREAGR